MGEERWRRSLRSGWGVLIPGLLAPAFLFWSTTSLPPALRLAAAVLGVVSLASAVDAWGSGVVVGSEGIRVRRALVRRRLRWEDVDGFAAERRGMRGDYLTVRAVPRQGRAFPVHDYVLPEEAAESLLRDLAAELEAHRR